MSDEMSVSLPAEEWPCEVHKYHGSSRPLRTVRIYILPLEWGGRNDQTNWVWICDNGWHAVRRILDFLRDEDLKILHGTGEAQRVMGLRPPFGGSMHELKIAREGYRRWVVAGRPQVASSQ